MTEYPSNSNKSKEQETRAVPEKNIQRVTSKSAKLHKKSEFRKFTDVFVSEDVDSVKKYILLDVVVPAVKKAIVDVVSDGINMLMYGETGSHKDKTFASKISYNKYYKDKDDRGNRERYSQIRSGYEFQNPIIDSRGEAEDVLSHMDDLIETYGTVSIADLYDLCGITAQYTDNKYGWTDIRNASVARIREGYVIKMPRPMPLD